MTLSFLYLFNLFLVSRKGFYNQFRILLFFLTPPPPSPPKQPPNSLSIPFSLDICFIARRLSFLCCFLLFVSSLLFAPPPLVKRWQPTRLYCPAASLPGNCHFACISPCAPLCVSLSGKTSLNRQAFEFESSDIFHLPQEVNTEAKAIHNSLSVSVSLF